MRKIFLGVLLLWVGCRTLQAQDLGLYWKYKDYDGVALMLPNAVLGAASWFVEDREDRRLLRRMRNLRVLVFEDYNPITQNDMRRFNRKATHRHLEDLIFVREGKTQVRILGKERRNALRKVVVFVDSPEEFVLLSLRGKLRWDDVQSMIERYGEDVRKKNGKPVVPPVVKEVPVSRI